VRNEELLLRVKERKLLHKTERRNANWICHILRRNCLITRVVEGKMEGRLDVMGWRGRRRDHLLDYLKEKMGRGSTRSRYVTNSVRKKQWICRKTDYGMKCASLL